MTNIKHSSATVEHYTPIWLVEKARYVLGEIDLDPASSPIANEAVKARRVFTAEQNALWQPEWKGRTFLNPPGGLVDGLGQPVIRGKKGQPGCTETGVCGLPPGHAHENVTSSQVAFWRVITSNWQSGNIPAAFFVGFSVELLQQAQSFVGPQPLDFVCCIPSQRIKFDRIVDGKRVVGRSPTHANILVLIGGERSTHELFRYSLLEVGYIHQPKESP